MVNNSLCSAWDMGLIPEPGRSRKLRGNYAHVPQLPKAVCLEPVLYNKRNHRSKSATEE